MTRNRPWTTVAGALLLVAGCCTAPPKESVCASGLCKAEIAVRNCEAGDITVSPDPIRVHEPSTIEWTLTDPVYRFAERGIQIPPRNEDFVIRGASAEGRKFTVLDKYTTRGTTKYAIEVVRRSDNVACKPKDPVIIND